MSVEVRCRLTIQFCNIVAIRARSIEGKSWGNVTNTNQSNQRTVFHSNGCTRGSYACHSDYSFRSPFVSIFEFPVAPSECRELSKLFARSWSFYFWLFVNPKSVCLFAMSKKTRKPSLFVKKQTKKRVPPSKIDSGTLRIPPREVFYSHDSIQCRFRPCAASRKAGHPRGTYWRVLAGAKFVPSLSK